MGLFIQSPQVVETVSGTVSRIGPFLEVGASGLTYELRLEGQDGAYLLGMPPDSRRCGIHLTRAGDVVEFGLLAGRQKDRSRRGLLSTFRNLTLGSAGVEGESV